MARASFSDLRKNCRDYDGSASEKATKAAANTLRKIVRLSDCSGRRGERGC
ncbi:MAG: hypothetical protein ACRDY7_05305 [Acidimicrobiia bacterium]